MTGLKRTAATVFELTVEAKVCSCPTPPMPLAMARKLDRILPVAEGYWTVYLNFWGDQMVWVLFTITDVRDGTVVWRNGRLMEGVDSGKLEGTDTGS